MNNSGASPIPLFRIRIREKGHIKDVRDIIARVDSMSSCLNGQIVDMGDGVKGIIMGYDLDSVLVLVMGNIGKLRIGKEVHGISEPFTIPVGDDYIGRMVDAQGNVCDNGDIVTPSGFLSVFRESPPLMHRSRVDEFMPVGTKIIDAVVPIAKGQRQLIMGDRLTGKTVIALDAIINQRGRDVVCIYCCIGKSVSAVEKSVSILKQHNALDYTIVMIATDNAPVGEQYIVPFSAAAMGEHFVSQGRDVLVVFDDLTKHAWAYRELSLLLERPPGREAYPGDIFYIQTQLMERAGKFNEKAGGGSMTFIGIAETLQGDMTGYIPSNLSSMCDGQIVLSTTVFTEGLRPAIDFSLSLSIIGGRVQPPALKELGVRLRADYARYTEVLRLSKLQTVIADDAQQILDKGQAMMTLLQQEQHHPLGIAESIVMLYTLREKFVQGLPQALQIDFRNNICDYIREHDGALLHDIEIYPELRPDIVKRLDTMILRYLDEQKEKDNKKPEDGMQINESTDSQS